MGRWHRNVKRQARDVTTRLATGAGIGNNRPESLSSRPVDHPPDHAHPVHTIAKRVERASLPGQQTRTCYERVEVEVSANLEVSKEVDTQQFTSSGFKDTPFFSHTAFICKYPKSSQTLGSEAAYPSKWHSFRREVERPSVLQ